MAEALLHELRRALPGLEIREEEPLKGYTSFAIGGPAEMLLLPASSGELAALCALLRRLVGEDARKAQPLLEARDIADPWYTGDFDTTFDDITEGCTALLQTIRRAHGI